MKSRDDMEHLEDDFGFLRDFHIEKDRQRKILITGEHSFIGTSFQKYAKRYYPNLHVDAISVYGDAWETYDFSCYDTVLHVAGIAHSDTTRISKEKADQYYRVNTELSLKVADYTKSAGVSQFIFMSSMIIYGESSLKNSRIITGETTPTPRNAYGDSKWRADESLRCMSDSGFNVAVVRSPMVYGRDCKGNFRLLERIARKLSVFPYFDNKRSLIYIDNLCEFICLLALSGEGGIYFPQNPEYANTSEIVRELGVAVNSPVHLSHVMTPFIYLASLVPGRIGRMTNKAFGSIVYDKKLSDYNGMDYQLVDLKKSIKELRLGS